jgi:tRNA-dihydrouridine synthase 1
VLTASLQFAANDPQLLLAAARGVEDHCDGVDLNLGCPQHIAKRGHFGSYLQEDWPLIFSLINTLHLNLKVPVTAKMRVFPTTERTVAYARMLERAGAQVIAVHGRTREMKGHKTGLADWRKIRAVKEAVAVPVIANGNVLYPADVEEALRITGADAVMSAEGNLYTPTIFGESPAAPSQLYPMAPELPFPDIVELAREYLDIVAALKTPTAVSAIRSHLFKICRPAFEVHRDLRGDLGKARPEQSQSSDPAAIAAAFRPFIDLLAAQLEEDKKDPQYQTAPASRPPGSVPLRPDGGDVLEEGADPRRPSYIPHWLAQPYFRAPMPPQQGPDAETPAAQAAREARAERVLQTQTPQVRKRSESPAPTAQGQAPVEINDKQAQDEQQMAASLDAPAGAAQAPADEAPGEDEPLVKKLRVR